jgi:NAD(P)-dependent dehydrogenase (short-subunit alcohol dehydrogenase family)
MTDWTSKGVLVLGAGTAGNMGQAIARLFREQGAKVMVAGRSEPALKQFAAEIGADYALCDIAKKADIDRLVEQACRVLGHLDVGINASGFNVMKPFLDTTEEDLERITRVQFIGPFQFYQALVRNLRPGGSVLQISSATATIMLDNHTAYMGTKAGADHVVRAVANEFGEKGIRANVIAPGLTDSPMASRAFSNPEVIKLFDRETPLGRTGTPEDIAHACLWAASDECYMTGQVFQVNGGVTLRRNPRAAEIAAVAAASAQK